MSLKLVFVNSYLSISHFKGNIFPSMFVETAGIHRAEILSVHKSKSLSEGGAMAGDLRLPVTHTEVLLCFSSWVWEGNDISYPRSGLEQVVTPRARICAESKEPTVVFLSVILISPLICPSGYSYKQWFGRLDHQDMFGVLLSFLCVCVL